MHSFTFGDGAVYSISLGDGLLFAGGQGGLVKVFDLDSLFCIRSVQAHSTDVSAVHAFGRTLWTGDASGDLKVYSGSSTVPTFLLEMAL